MSFTRIDDLLGAWRLESALERWPDLNFRKTREHAAT